MSGVVAELGVEAENADESCSRGDVYRPPYKQFYDTVRH